MAGDDVRAWVEDPTALATLRRDALLAVDAGEGLDSGRDYARAQGLELHTFLRGNKAPGCAPALVGDVYEFWNINSLLRAMYSPRFPEQGLAVALIRDPEEPLHSFFVLAIRNGDLLHVLTDRSRDHQTHPLRKKMGRRPDREMDARASKWWFPYELLDVAVSEDGKHAHANARMALVPLNASAAPLRKLAELHPATQVWLCLVLSIVRQRFFQENRQAKVLSYTGEMARVPTALAAQNSALMRHGQYKPLVLPPVAQTDLTPQAMAQNCGRAASGRNRWMVERYQDQVPDAVLNVVGDQERQMLSGSVPQATSGLIRGWGGESSTSVENLPSYAPDRGVGDVRLEALDPTTFGPADQIRKDQTWLAQHNRMRTIQRLAVEEFARTQAEVLRWYTKTIRARREFFLDALATASLVMPSAVKVSESDQKPDDVIVQAIPGVVRRVSERLAVGVGPAWWSDNVRWGPPSLIFWAKDKPSTPRDRALFLREDDVSRAERMDAGLGVFGLIVPRTAEAVAFLCGCEVSALPWQLQRYHDHEFHASEGNHILQRIDPEAYCLDNPWRGLDLRIGMGLARTRANARRKALGLPKMDWDGLVQSWEKK